MAEAFELVRTVRQHLRRSGSLLDEGRLDEALKEAESALALDAHSLPARALRNRIQSAKAAAHPPVAGLVSDHQPLRPFVPHGVNAASWRGFEQRITERRFRALLETINTAIVALDVDAARLALEEARELQPDASELDDLAARVAAMPPTSHDREATQAARLWMRAIGAAALFLAGVSLLLGIEWIRTSDPVAPPAPTHKVQAAGPADGRRSVVKPNLQPMPVAINDEDESVPAVATPSEPLLRPRATTGTARPEPRKTTPTPTVTTRPSIVERSIARGGPLPGERALEQRPIVEDPPVRPSGEVSDDYVATALRPMGPVAEGGRPPVPSARPFETTASETRGHAAETPAPVPAASAPGRDQSRVEDALRRYARAYGALDAEAARAVWPSVDEKALARAFQNLASQNVSFDDCDIDIRGAVASASCRGQASYVGKVGSRERRTEMRLWRFELRREGDAWKIENAEARRQSAANVREQ